MADITQFLTNILGISFGAIGAWLGVRQFYAQSLREKQLQLQQLIDEKSNAATKAYAAQRDFEHLKRNQEQLKTAISQLQEEQEATEKLLIELRVQLQGTSHQVERIATRIEGNH